jgi:hypothetical protein
VEQVYSGGTRILIDVEFKVSLVVPYSHVGDIKCKKTCIICLN